MGMPYLFLDAEYLDQVNFFSFLIVGVLLGAFTMAFHITTFILDSHKFAFLSTIDKPMKVYTFNNSLIPNLTILTYSYQIFHFQLNKGNSTLVETILYVAGLLVGFFGIQFLSVIMFRQRNNKLLTKLTHNLDVTLKRKAVIRELAHENMINLERRKNKLHLDYFVEFPFKFHLIDHSLVPNKKVLTKIFDRNHLEAVILQIIAMCLILIMGFFSEFKYFEIPAAGSGLMVLSIVLLVIGALSFWMRTWAISVTIVGFIVINYIMQYNAFNTTYEAFGINYNTSKADYTTKNLKYLTNEMFFVQDSTETIHILENWLKKNTTSTGKKPKMLFVCTSGGGQRAATWTVNTLQTLDSATNFKISKQTQLMSGASGGLIGAAYYRELYLRKITQGINPCDRKYYNNMAKDVLNPVIFNMVVNDFIFRFKHFSDGKYTYAKDRGFAFEKHLNDNLDSVLSKPLLSYRDPEKNSQIPMLLIAPTITNDGRKLYISPQNISFMNNASPCVQSKLNQRVKGVEFLRVFKNQDAENLNYASALRMSATFPYIMPNVTLPSEPVMEIMDAGLSDNFGITNAVQFIDFFREWIDANTDGVLFVIIRDSEKELEIEKTEGRSLVQRALNPIGGIFNSWDFIQDNNNDIFIDFLRQTMRQPVDIVEFKYLPETNSTKANASSKERASLSWHLTKNEKSSIRKTIYSNFNKKSLHKLQKLLD